MVGPWTGQSPVCFSVREESTEGLKERRPSPRDLDRIFYYEGLLPPSPVTDKEDGLCLSKLMADVNAYVLLRMN